MRSHNATVGRSSSGWKEWYRRTPSSLRLLPPATSQILRLTASFRPQHDRHAGEAAAHRTDAWRRAVDTAPGESRHASGFEVTALTVSGGQSESGQPDPPAARFKWRGRGTSSGSIPRIRKSRRYGARPTGALPILTFVLTLGVFALAPTSERDTFGRSLNSRKTMENKHFHRSSSEGCAVSSVVEHFLDTEGVRGSNPLSRTIPIESKVWFRAFQRAKLITRTGIFIHIPRTVLVSKWFSGKSPGTTPAYDSLRPSRQQEWSVPERMNRRCVSSESSTARQSSECFRRPRLFGREPRSKRSRRDSLARWPYNPPG